jgi:hypothetical protein
VDECSEVSDFQLQENDSDARNYNLHAIYADRYMKYIKLEPDSLAERYSSRLIKTNNTYISNVSCRKALRGSAPFLCLD